MKGLESEWLVIWNWHIQWGGRKKVLSILEEGKDVFLSEKRIGLMAFCMHQLLWCVVLVWRIRLIHVCRRDLKESFERGMVQFAELMSPAQSVIRGPLVIGFLVNKVLHVDKSWLISEDWETQGEMMLMIAEAKANGYSAVSALIKVPSGSLFPLKSMWSRCEQWPAKLEIRSDVAAMAQYWKNRAPICMLE